MSDDNQQDPPALPDLIKQARREIKARLRQAPNLLLPEAADRAANEYAHRLVPFPNGVVRVLMPGSNSKFYEVDDTGDTLAPLLMEIARNAPDEDRLEAVAQRQQNIQELNEEKVASGQYRM